MPASICDPVSSALRLSLTADESQSSSLLDSRLYSSAKSALLSKIDFEESGDYQSNVLDGLKSKYVVIRPKKPVLESKLLKKESISANQTSGTYLQTMLTLFSCFRSIGLSDDKIKLEVIFLTLSIFISSDTSLTLVSFVYTCHISFINIVYFHRFVCCQSRFILWWFLFDQFVH